MAGSIPPLVSSSPPPLCPFEDEEEEEGDEFGMYTSAEEIDYNDCITFKVKGCEKQDGEKSRGEHDSTSQDSATDSGLCPDSEGMSPTPHSDEERSVKQGLSVCEPTSCDTAPELPNGYVSASAEDDFGNFEAVEFTSADCPHFNEQGISNDLQFRSLEKENDDNSLLDYKDCCGNEVSTSVVETPSSQSVHRDNSSESKNAEALEECTLDTVSETLSSQTIQLDSFQEICTESKSAEPIEEFAKFETLDPVDEQDSHKEYTEEEILNIEDGEHCVEENATLEQEGDEFDDFTDFKANCSNSWDIPETEQSDKFSEHSKPSEDLRKSIEPSCQGDSDDEFSNFADFSSSDCAFVSAQSNSLESCPNIPLKRSDDNNLRTESEFQDWVSVFPSPEAPPPEVEGLPLLQPNDAIWVRLSPLESSPALSYQWADSLAYQQLLSALNIDSRNILWNNNSSVPRFAANLSCGPLQPTKAPEPLLPTTAATTHHPTPVTNQEVVPDAHFDWVSSGLTNPLDSSHSSLLDLNFMVTLSTHLSINPKPVLNLQKTLSSEAETILRSLPDLSFMRKTYIDFPINEG